MTIFTSGSTLPPFGPYPDPKKSCDCECPCGCDAKESSLHPIRYQNGQIEFAASDLGGDGFGLPWGHERQYSNRLLDDGGTLGSFDAGQGYNWMVAQWPFLARQSDGTVITWRGAGEVFFFEEYDFDQFVARYGAHLTLTLDAGIYTLTGSDGVAWEFNGFEAGQAPGMLRGVTTAGGQRLEVVAYQSDRIAAVERTAIDDSGNACTERLEYEYFDNGGEAGPLECVTLRRRTSPSGPWIDIRRAVYSYYEDGDDHGNAGDLKTATIQAISPDGWTDLDTQYYRYWQDDAGGSGFRHGLKYVLGPDAFARLAADPLVADPLAADDSQVAAYADYYFEYDNQQRVTRETVAGGSRAYEFTYEDRAVPDYIDYNHWVRKTTETLSNGSQNIVFTNHIGQVLLREFRDGDDSWIEHWQYSEPDAHELLHAHASAVSGYGVDPVTNALDVSLKPHDGLIEVREYYLQDDPATGAVEGELACEKLKRGEQGDEIVLRRREYTHHGDGGRMVHPLAKETVFRDEDGSGAIETRHDYTFHPGTVQIEQRLTTLPAVPAEQNGSGVSATRTERFDVQGNLTWWKDERGFIHRHKYDVVTGALVQSIQDVDTTLVTDAPDGWMTQLSGGLHLVTDFQHDDQGRIVQELGPVHEIDLDGVPTEVRTATWTQYDEGNRTVRTAQGYVGYASQLATLINPISITKLDAVGRAVEEIQAAAPQPFTDSTDPLEELGNLIVSQNDYVRWTTHRYNDAGQLEHTRVYHSIPSASGSGPEPGVEGDNYNETQFAYDASGNQIKTRSPGGTITRTVSDAHDRVLQTYIGTDDTGATPTDPTGGGAGGNNMVLVSESEYDTASNGGDGNLTCQRQYVDATTVRETTYEYDWRNRRTVTDGEEDMYEKTYYDNLSRAVKSERYDTDEAGNLVARSETRYDERGHAYQSIQHGIDQATGQPTGESIIANTTFDDADNVIHVAPHGAAEFATFGYDSLNRQVRQTDPLNHTTATAHDAVGNVVTTTDAAGHGSHRGYDALGRLIRVTDPLGHSTGFAYNDQGQQSSVTDPNGHITQTQYDAAGQQVAAIDALGHTAYFEYDADGNQTAVIDRNGNRTEYAFDHFGRHVKTTDAVNDTTQTVYNLQGEPIAEIDGKGNATTYAYDGLGRRIAITDRLGGVTSFAFDALGNQVSITDAESQTTTYEFDPFGRSWRTIWPDHVPGTAAGDLDYGITQTEYDHLGRTLRTTDQQGDTITYIFDDAGRMIQRDYRTLADGSTDSITDGDTFTYDAVGRTVTAYKGRYDSTVTFAYDAAGRRTSESLTIYGQSYPVGSEYDSASQLVKLIYPDGTPVERSYTARGELHQISYDGQVIDTRIYDAGGRLTTNTYGNGITTTRTYRPDNLTASIDISGVDHFAYSYDSNKNKTAETRTGVMQPYGFTADYDAEGRLITWQRDDGNLGQSWKLTPVGDWLEFTQNGIIECRVHSPAHEITSVDNKTLSYDAKGNLTTNFDGDVYVWDMDNMMRSASGASHVGETAATHDYAFDAFGRRVCKSSPDGEFVEVRRDMQMLCKYAPAQAAPNPIESRVYGTYIDELVSLHQIGGQWCVHFDSVFSIVAISSNDGAIMERYAYTSFGQPVLLTPLGLGNLEAGCGVVSCPAFTGQLMDAEVRLFHFRARQYDYMRGRFASRDPIHYVDGKNLYNAYFVPNGTDPSGLAQKFCKCALISVTSPMTATAVGAFKKGDTFFVSTSPGTWTGEVLKDLVCKKITTYTLVFKCLECPPTPPKSSTITKVVRNERWGTANLGKGIFGLKATVSIGPQSAVIGLGIAKFVGFEANTDVGQDDIDSANHECAGKGGSKPAYLGTSVWYDNSGNELTIPPTIPSIPYGTSCKAAKKWPK